MNETTLLNIETRLVSLEQDCTNSKVFRIAHICSSLVMLIRIIKTNPLPSESLFTNRPSDYEFP